MKLLLSTTDPLYGDKGADLAKRVAAFLGIEPEDVLVLPQGVTVTELPYNEKHKPTKAEAATAEAAKAAEEAEHPAKHGHGHKAHKE
jgi:hypothetical protein